MEFVLGIIIGALFGATIRPVIIGIYEFAKAKILANRATK